MAASPAAAEALALSAGGFTPDVRLVEDSPPHWVSLTGMANPRLRGERYRAIAEAAGPGAPTSLPLVWEIEAAAWYVGVAVGEAALRNAARPNPGPEATWVRIGADGLASGIALHAAGELVAPRAATARVSIATLLAPVVESAGVSSRALWWHVGDRIADALLCRSDALGSPRAAIALAEAVLAPGVSYAVPLGIEGAGPRVRRTCCLARRLPGEAACEGCPLRGRPNP